MSIFNALVEFLDFLELLLAWRLLLATAIGVGATLALYYVFGKTPASAAVAFALGSIGVCAGLIWQFRHERRR